MQMELKAEGIAVIYATAEFVAVFVKMQVHRVLETVLRAH